MRKGMIRMLSLLLITIVLSSIDAPAIHAGDKYWINHNSNADWDTSIPATNWSSTPEWLGDTTPTGVPVAGDFVIIRELDGYPDYNKTIDSNNIDYLGPLSILEVDSFSGGYTINWNYGAFFANKEIIANEATATFNQIGGTHYVLNSLSIGDGRDEGGMPSNGQFNLSGGAEMYVVGTEMIGGDGNGTFTHIDGNHQVNSLVLGGGPTGTGSYTLESGILYTTNEEIVGDEGIGTFIQSGGTHRVNGSFSIGQDGTFDYSGGSFEAFTITNEGDFNLSGLGTRSIDSYVINNGNIKTTGTDVNWAGVFINNGVYESDPSDNFFETVVIDGEGSFIGGPDDRFFVDMLILEMGSTLILDGVQFIYKDLIDEGGTVKLLGGAEISQVPIPGAVWLLGSGLIGIVGFRRKFKK